jgi:hypothetical protein
VYQNKSFEDICLIAKARNRPFCIVLSDSTQNMSKEYLMYLQNSYKYLTKKVIYNMADINVPGNDWYVKWLCPESTPLTCVFSANGTLIDLIPGVARETFLYTSLAIQQTITDYHWPNAFNSNKMRVIPLLNNILQQKLHIEQYIFSSSEMDSLIDSLNYPYPYYLKIMGELMKNDTVAAKHTSELLINLEDPNYLNLFKNEFIIAKRILNPNFNIDDEPNIRIDSNSIFLSNCITGKNNPFEVVLYNEGRKLLKVSNILTSCSCVELTGDNKQFVIREKDSSVVQFNFISNVEGNISRDIYIFSNAINKPILNLQIRAIVVSLKDEINNVI